MKLQTPSTPYAYATFFHRLLAHTFDSILIVFPIIVFLYVTTGSGTILSPQFTNFIVKDINRIYITVFYCLASATYNIICNSVWGKTLGKSFFNIRIINATGIRPTLGQIITRETFGKLISATLLNAGYLGMLLNKRSQTFHDAISGTFVVNKNNVSDYKKGNGVKIINSLLFVLLLGVNSVVSGFVFVILSNTTFGQTLIVQKLFIKEYRISKKSLGMPVYPPESLILVDIFTPRLSPRFKREEIILYKVNNPEFKDRVFVGRIIGLPNETIKLMNYKVYVNNTELFEPYLSGKTTPGIYLHQDEELIVPAGNYFIMSDAREVGIDSRTTFGAIQGENIVGRVLMCAFKCINVQRSN